MFDKKPYELLYGDCYELLKSIPNNSVDMILTDPPYGQTPLEWDKSIDLNALWYHIRGICKPNACICIFAQEPFASHLRLSNLNWYKYDWYWKKERPTNIFQVKRRPAKYVENICVFYKEQCTYNEEKVLYTGDKLSKNSPKGKSTQTISTNELIVTPYEDDGTRHPSEILEVRREYGSDRVHPTQKPVTLLEYLIKTYTNKDQVVLDMFMGSGSTGVACMKQGRRFIGMELDENYFNISKNRITKTYNELNKKLF